MSKNVKQLLEKARDSATQAVSTYNDPRSSFRTGNFAILMMIAWTSLLHAYFETKKIKYFYKEGRFYVRVDGDKKAWELSECVKNVFSENDPIRKNLELFIKIRNKIEHRNLPAVDPELVGECQALVLNFEDWLKKKFGNNQSLLDTIFVPLQLTNTKRSKLHVSKTEKEILGMIHEYRRVLDTDIDQSQQYSFKAFLVPKIGNHRSSSDVAIEFVKYDSSKPEEMEKYEKAIVAIKEKQVPVANIDLMKPSDVVQTLLGKGCLAGLSEGQRMHWHTKMWKKYKVRPASASGGSCKAEFCVRDDAHGDYLYTKKWVEFLMEKELKAS